MNNLFPMSMRIAAQTIGSDLVTVKPMSGPSNILYMDNWIDENIINEKLLKERSEKIKNILNLDGSEDI
jgi:hypothetical protein